MVVIRKGQFAAGKKSNHIVEGEILHIGAHPHGYSNLQHIVLGLTNSQAAEYMELGWDVRMSNKETYFLGRKQEETILYIVLDIPKLFEVDKISSWRTSAYLQDTTRAVVEFSTQEVIFEYYDASKPNKVSFSLILDEIYMVDNEEEEDGIEPDPYLTKWRVGDPFIVDGLHFTIGRIDPDYSPEMIYLRLDRKPMVSTVVRVPR